MNFHSDEINCAIYYNEQLLEEYGINSLKKLALKFIAPAIRNTRLPGLPMTHRMADLLFAMGSSLSRAAGEQDDYIKIHVFDLDNIYIGLWKLFEGYMRKVGVMYTDLDLMGESFEIYMYSGRWFML